MRKPYYPIIVILLVVVSLFSCGKKKPTAPQPLTHAVTLQYQNYLTSTCLRLIVGYTAVNVCGLTRESSAVTAGEYDYRLYSVTNPGPTEVLALIISGRVNMDRPKTLIVDGSDIYWWWWAKN